MTNLFTTNLKKDSRGRVRFTHNGYRFDVTSARTTVYHRTKKAEWRALKIPANFLNSPAFMDKLTEAQLLATI